MLDHIRGLAFLENTGVDLHGTNNVRIDVGGRSSVLNISLSVVVSSVGGNAERSSSVSDAEREFTNVRGLVNAGHSLLVVVTVQSNVEVVLLAESYHHIVDVLHASGAFSHGLSREVRVAARSVPIGEGFRSERKIHVEVFSNTE